MAKKEKETFIHVTARMEEDGITVFSHKGVDVAWRLPKGGVVDLRTSTPFLPMSPCPYCGAENDKGHNPTPHIHAYLGTSV